MNEIKCPKCGTEIPVSEVIIQRVKDQIRDAERKQIEKEFAQKESGAIKELETKLLDEKRKFEIQQKIEQQKREESQKKELETLKLKSDLEDRMKGLDLEVQKRLFEEKKTIEEKATKEAQQLYELKLAEKEKQLDDTKKSLAEAQRKAHQGSMQTQGEVLELSIEELLSVAFPLDNIEPVPKGINGADIIQAVYTNGGASAGKIAWELKRTKHWTEEWVQKLKDDCRACHADIAILVSEVLPKDIESFGPYKGIWVCNYSIIKGVAAIMRQNLINVSGAMMAQQGKDQKMEALYNYLTSNTFAQKIEALVETFLMMKTDLDREKISFQKLWGKRESQILRLTDNTAKMYGEIQGIAGAALPDIEILELNEGKLDLE